VRKKSIFLEKNSTFRSLFLVLLLFLSTLFNSQLLWSSSFFKNIGNILKIVQQADQMLWLLGDPAAERRFGFLMSRFLIAFHSIDKNEDRNKWVNKVFQRVVEPGRRDKFQYRIYIVRNKEINAFALPGGYVFIHTGMLDFVKSDDELACVIAHELAHINRRHSLNSLRRNYAFIQLLNLVLNDTKNDDKKDTIAKITWMFLEQKNSRRNEREADQLGMEWAMKAGYNPSGMVTLWQNMEKKHPYQRDLLTRMLSTHPPSSERAATARRLLSEWNIEFVETNFLTCGVNTVAQKNIHIDGDFEETNGGTKSDKSWLLSSGAEIVLNAGRNNSNGLQLYRRSASEECTARSKAVKFSRDSAIHLSASIKGYKKSPGKLWLGVEFLDIRKTAIGVSFFAAEGMSSIPETWTTFSRTFNENHSNDLSIPPETNYCSVVVAGCERIGDRIWVDNIALSISKLPEASVTSLEGSTLPTRRVKRTNTLPNGSFENDMNGDNKADRWTCSGGTTIRSGNSNHGASSLKMTGQKNQRREFAISERIPVTPGARYILQGMFKADQKTDVTFGVRIFSPDFSELIAGQDLQTHTISRDVWTIREQRVTVPSGEAKTFYLQIWIRTVPEIGKNVYVDNVSLFYGSVSKDENIKKVVPSPKKR
jgi:Zn-dependent protease with chaperone function